MHERIPSYCSVSTCLACSEHSDSGARVKYRPRKKRGEGRLGERVGIFSLVPVPSCFSLVFPNARRVRVKLVSHYVIAKKDLEGKG